MAKTDTRRAAARRPVAMATADFLGTRGARALQVGAAPTLGLPATEVVAPAAPIRVSAPAFLAQAIDTIERRGQERDTGASAAPAERSMAATVTAFNAIHGTALTERQGWAFMQLLKITRAHTAAINGKPNPDDYLDGAAYAALAGECVRYPAPAAA